MGLEQHVAFMQVGDGGICFAHGPYTGARCPRFEDFSESLVSPSMLMSACITDPQNPEYVQMAQDQMRVTNPIYTQAQLEEAVGREYQRVVTAIRDLRLSYVPTNTVLEAIAPRSPST